jgi:hypothetical protein
MDEVLERYLQASGRFYMHTDSRSLAHSGVSAEDFASPKEENEREFLVRLTTPSNIVCGHIRLTLENPNQYGVREELVRKALESIFRAFWNKKDVEIEVLEGEHKEGAVVNVLLEGDVNEDTEIPAISPNISGEEVFVNHPQATKFLREELGKQISEITGLDVESRKYNEIVKQLGEQQLAETVARLAKDLPVYNIVFNGESKKVSRIEKVE